MATLPVAASEIVSEMTETKRSNTVAIENIRRATEETPLAADAFCSRRNYYPE